MDNNYKEELNSLINAGSDDFPQFQVQPIEPLDIGTMNEKTKMKAQKVVLSCLKLYFDEKIITKNEFIQAKTAITTGNLKTLLRQVMISEHMVNKIINSVDNGDMNPRLYEVAAQLQANIVLFLRNIQLHVISMQEEFRRLKSEIPNGKPTEPTIINLTQGGSDTKIYTNAKSLLNDIDNTIEDEDEY
jgi:hypothetical protein